MEFDPQLSGLEMDSRRKRYHRFFPYIFSDRDLNPYWPAGFPHETRAQFPSGPGFRAVFGGTYCPLPSGRLYSFTSLGFHLSFNSRIQTETCQDFTASSR